jgi:hypothetical protein
MGTIYIFGGHTLAQSYFSELMQAREQGAIAFADIYCIDATQDCPAKKNHPDHFIARDPADFILEYLTDTPADAKQDAIIPDHTAQHVFLKVFLNLAARHPNTRAALAPFHSDLQTPFLHKNEDNSVWAVSYATWSCPPECDEPAICPHTQNKRDWDFNRSLTELRQTLPATTSLHLFACQTLWRHIAQIPAADILQECSRFVQNLTAEKITHALIGTHSHCHGILGHLAIERA